MIEERFGEYQILAPLGEGGMGTVVIARHATLGREVALKRLLPGALGDEESVQRFQREIRLAAALSHPNLIRVFDAGAVAGVPYVAMELVVGSTLSTVARDHAPLPWPLVLALGAQLADGLAHLHGQGILHRDIKHANVILTNSGHLKLLDFGLAFRAGSTAITEVGFVVGTLQYLAPEFVEGYPASERTDLWALGIVLYDLLTGQHAIDLRAGESWMQTLLAAQIPAPHLRVPAVPRPVSDLVMRLLSRDPGGRPRSAALLSEQLAASLADHSGDTIEHLLRPGVLDRIAAHSAGLEADPMPGGPPSAYAIPLEPEPGGPPEGATRKLPPMLGIDQPTAVLPVDPAALLEHSSSLPPEPSRPPAGLPTPRRTAAPDGAPRSLPTPPARRLSGRSRARSGSAAVVAAVDAPAAPAAAMPALRRVPRWLAVPALLVVVAIGLGTGRGRPVSPVPAGSLLPVAPSTSPAGSPRSPVPISRRGDRLHFSSGWKIYEAELDNLRAGGVVARLATLQAEAVSPVKLGSWTAGWVYWIQLGRWLESPGRAPEPPRLPGASRLPMDGGDEEIAYASLRGVRGLTTELFARVLRLPAFWPEDGRSWLLLGRTYQLDSDLPNALKLYELGLRRTNAAAMHGAPHMLWVGLLCAIVELRPHAMAASWRSFLSDADTPIAWGVVEEMIRWMGPDRLRELVEVGLQLPAHQLRASYLKRRYYGREAPMLFGPLLAGSEVPPR